MTFVTLSFTLSGVIDIKTDLWVPKFDAGFSKKRNTSKHNCLEVFLDSVAEDIYIFRFIHIFQDFS
jgi:hypothetical protein